MIFLLGLQWHWRIWKYWITVCNSKQVWIWYINAPYRSTVFVHMSITMMTSSNGNIFRVTGPLCGEFTGPGEVPTQRPVTRIFDAFFDMRLNKRLSKQPWGWWFEASSWSLWRQCNISEHYLSLSALLATPSALLLQPHIVGCRYSPTNCCNALHPVAGFIQCIYLSMFGLKLIHVSNMGLSSNNEHPWHISYEVSIVSIFEKMSL